MRAIALALCLVFLTSGISHAIGGPTRTKRERMKEEARNFGPSVGVAYEKIHENFLKENYSEVVRLSSDYLAPGRTNKDNREDVLYLQALSLLKLNRSQEARERLKELEILFVPMDRKASASASVGDSYFYEGNFPLARQSYEETLRKYPNTDQTAYIRGQLSELSAKLGSPTGFLPISRSPKQFSLNERPLFTVQVGSFSMEKNAKALVNKLIFRRYDAYLEKDESDRMYRVRVGKLSSREEASMLELRLKREGYPTKIYP